MGMRDSRRMAVADALGSTRAEGLESSAKTLLLVERWTRGEIGDADLEAAACRIVEASTQLPGPIG